MQGDILRETAQAYQREYREAKPSRITIGIANRKQPKLTQTPVTHGSGRVKRRRSWSKNRASIMGQIAEQLVIPEMISEARMKEAEENLEFFATQETVEDIEIEKAKATFSPEERERFKDNPHLSQLIFHQDLQTDHAKNQKILKGYLSDKTEERREFVLDVYRTVNEMPADTFKFDGPTAFREKYAAMYGTCRKILTYRSVLADGFQEEQAALKESHPELVRSFEDRMEYFTKCAKLFGLYRSYLSTGE
jgi:hypothetical protein